MGNFVDPEEIAFGSVDDDVAEGVARSMGYRGWSNVIPQEPVRLPEFGPRKIHSTPEIVPDPLLAPPAIPATTWAVTTAGAWSVTGIDFASPDYQNVTVYFDGAYYYWSHDNVFTKNPPTYLNRKPRERAPSNKPQWARKFYENRPTERPKVGRPKRKRA